MKKKKVTALFLTALLTVSSMVAGCSGTSSGSASESGSSNQETAADVREEPTQATLVLYGEESPRMTEFAENEFHDKVLEAINVDVTIQYLPWSEYAGGKTELMLSSGEKFCHSIF